MRGDRLVEKLLAGGCARDIIKGVEESYSPDTRRVARELRNDLIAAAVSTAKVDAKQEGVVVDPSPDTTKEQAYIIWEMLEVYERVYPEVCFLVGNLDS